MDLFNQQYDLIRATEGSWTADHSFISGVTTKVPINCSIQPYREGRDTFRVEAGWKTRDVIKVYSDTAIIPFDEDKNTTGDEIIYNGLSYFCKDYQDWSQNGMLPHYLGIFYKKDKS